MVDILDWLQNEDIDTAGEILAAHPTNTARAEGALTGIGNTPERERGSIFGTALSLLDAYESHEALDAASDPNLDAAAFVRSTDTIYIAAPAEDQALTAPLVVGLLDDIRRAAYERQRQIDTGAEAQQWPVTMALDELANIAPIHDLKSMVSEGGSQGLHIIASFQDLGQIRARWGEHLADAALTLFGRKVILGGIGDTKTLEAISLMLNEFDRHIVTETANKGWTPVWGSTSMTTQRQRNWTPGGIREIAKGEALYLWQNNWTRMVLTDYSQHVPWPQVMASIQEHAAPSSQRP